MFSSNEWIGWFKNWNEICDRKSIRPIILWYRRYVFRSQPNGCLSGVASGERQKRKKNNTRDSNVVPHRSTNLARSCLTSLSRREAVLSWLYGRSCYLQPFPNPWSHHKRIHFIPLIHRTISNSQNDSPSHAPSPFTYPIILQPPFLPHTHLQPNAQHKIHTATLWSMLSYHQ